MCKINYSPKGIVVVLVCHYVFSNDIFGVTPGMPNIEGIKCIPMLYIQKYLNLFVFWTSYNKTALEIKLMLSSQLIHTRTYMINDNQSLVLETE